MSESPKNFIFHHFRQNTLQLLQNKIKVSDSVVPPENYLSSRYLQVILRC